MVNKHYGSIISKTITSAKNVFVRSLALAAVVTTTGCSAEDVNVTSIVDTVSSTTEVIKEKSEDLAEKIDKVEKISISELFKSPEDKYASKETTVYDEEGKEVMTFDINTLFKIVGISNDGKWFKTEDGFFIKNEGLTEEPNTYVKECAPVNVYSQYNNVRVHKEPNKSSETIYELPVNTIVLKSGDVKFGFSDLDASGDHAWSEVKFKVNGEITVGYVYSDYIGDSATSSTKTAVEIRSYSDAEKEDLKKMAEAYGIDSSNVKTDEQFSELEGNLYNAMDNEFNKELASSLEKLEKEAEKNKQPSTPPKKTHSEETWSDTQLKWVAKPYDHAATKALDAEFKKRQDAMDAAWGERGKPIDSQIEYGSFVVNGYEYNCKITQTFADGSTNVIYDSIG